MTLLTVSYSLEVKAYIILHYIKKAFEETATAAADAVFHLV